MAQEQRKNDVQAIMAALAAPFPKEAIEWRVGSTNAEKTRGLALPYLTSRAVQQRLDDVVGATNWRNSFERWGDNGVLGSLSIRIDGEWITKMDGAQYPDFEPIKGGFSDALKRAAVLWGIGRYLYDLPAQWVPIEVSGKSARIKEPPQLPDWALPEEQQGQGRPMPREAGGAPRAARAEGTEPPAAAPSGEAAPVCPRCGSPMRERTGPTGRFWGCTRYPECKGTRPAEEEQAEEAEKPEQQRAGR